MNLNVTLGGMAILAVLGAGPLRAADPVPAAGDTNAAAPAAAGTPAVEVVELRDPFWPITYKAPQVPRKIAAKEDAPPASTEDEWKRAHAKLRVGAVTRAGNRHLVLINGNTCQEGDVLAVELDGRLYRFQLRAVRMDRVEIRKLDVRAKAPPTP